MADYIYLLQNRLTPAQRRALEAVRETARTRAMPVFLVGGAVRDLSSGAPVRDLDFAVQGEVAGLLDELSAGGAVVAGQNPVLSSTYLIFPGGVRVEVGPALTVTYPKPGQPEAQPAAILEDLRRRDFTANAMAISLNEGSYGLLLDPLNGIADMENRELRLVSNYGFIEEPSLALRAARLSARLGWNLEERTQARYQTAKEENYIGSMSAFDRGYELEEIFHEDDPLSTWEHLASEGWSDTLFHGWNASKADREALDRVRDLMGQMDQMGIYVDPAPVFFPLLTAKLAGKEVATLKAMFPRQGFVAQIDSLEARSKDLANQLASKNAPPSETWKLLFASEPEVVLWLAYSSRSGPVQAKFRAFLNEWPQARQRLPYALMQEMRITPDLPGYEQLLEDLFFAQIDGKLASPEATRAFLEPYSPPAPAPQATPRRRPAKSARGRGRKAVEEVASPEPETLEGGLPADAQPGSEAGGEREATPVTTSEPAPVAAPKKTAPKAAAKKPAPQTEPAAAPVPAVPAKKGVPPKSVAKAPQKHAAPAKAAEKHAEPPKKAAAKPEAKTAPAAKKAVPPAAKGSTPASKKSAGSKAAPKPQKGKPAPAPAKKSPAKAVSARSAKTPTKAAPAAKGGAAKHPAKAVAKKTPPRATAPAKRPAPAKKGKTAAAKRHR